MKLLVGVLELSQCSAAVTVPATVLSSCGVPGAVRFEGFMWTDSHLILTMPYEVSATVILFFRCGH